MRKRTVLVATVSSTCTIIAGLLVACVSDDPGTPPIVVHDEASASDAPSSSDIDGSVFGADAGTTLDGSDAGIDSGPQCVFVDAGPHGVVDSTYSNGLVTLPLFEGQAVATIDSVGRVYIAFSTDHCASATSGIDIGVKRLLDTGLPDPNFGNGGLGCLSFSYNDGMQHDANDIPTAIALDSQGGVIVVGRSALAGPYTASIGHLDATGAVDKNFGSLENGMAEFDLFPAPFDAGTPHQSSFFAVTTIGTDIYVAGGTDTPLIPPSKFSSAYGVVLRLKATGTTESAFKPPVGSNGMRFDQDVSGWYSIAAVGGRLLVGGNRANQSIVRAITPSGVVDPTFGTGGDLVFAGEDGGVAGIAQIVAQSPTAIVTSGGGIQGPPPLFGDVFELRRFATAGTVDNTFATSGAMISSLYAMPITGATMSIGCDGRLLASGINNDTPYALGFTPNGTLDQSFGEAGALADPSFTGGVGFPHATLVDRRNGKILFVYGTDDPNVFVVRYNP